MTKAVVFTKYSFAPPHFLLLVFYGQKKPKAQKMHNPLALSTLGSSLRESGSLPDYVNMNTIALLQQSLCEWEVKLTSVKTLIFWGDGCPAAEVYPVLPKVP